MSRYSIEENAVILKALSTNDERLIGKYYYGLKREFEKNIARGFNIIPTRYLEDIYHDAFSELWEQSIQGKLTDATLTVPVGAYLQGIGVNMAHPI